MVSNHKLAREKVSGKVIHSGHASNCSLMDRASGYSDGGPYSIPTIGNCFFIEEVLHKARQEPTCRKVLNKKLRILCINAQLSFLTDKMTEEKNFAQNFDDECQCKRIAKHFEKAVCLIKGMMHLKTYICCNEDV